MDRPDAPGCTGWTRAELVCISLKEANMKTASRRKNTKLRVVPEASVDPVSPVETVETVETVESVESVESGGADDVAEETADD